MIKEFAIFIFVAIVFWCVIFVTINYYTDFMKSEGGEEESTTSQYQQGWIDGYHAATETLEECYK